MLDDEMAIEQAAATLAHELMHSWLYLQGTYVCA